jgi:hypothetical protein
MKNQLFKYYGIALLVLLIGSCSLPRQTWKGENSKKVITTFDKISNNKWEEKNKNGVFLFEEVSRNCFRIKLYDVDRKNYIKLTKTKCFGQDSFSNKWWFIYQGNWIK